MKLAMTLVAAFIFTGVMGQNTGATQWEDAAQEEVGDYVRSNDTPFNSPDAVNYTDKITVGKAMPFWVWPSAVYNPDFDFNNITSNATQSDIETGVISDFAWKMGEYDTDLSTTENAFDAAGEVTGFAKNYVEIEFPEAEGMGQRLIQVIESPAAGPCPADAVWLGVTVIDQPMVRFANAGATEAGVPNTIAIGCAGSAEVADAATAINIALDNTDEVVIGATDDSRYHINLNYTVYNVDIDGGTGDLEWASATSVGSPTLTVMGADGSSPVSQANPILAEDNTLIEGETYGLEGAKATVYEFELVDWNAGISRKSDYIAIRDGGTANYGDFDYYNHNTATDPVLVNRIVVLPNPVTGPIYHIPNDVSL
ncbi:MAG: hypothetical protein ACLFQA_08420 [Bacteroidales bacterium]